jgi:RHS repeat-associated protein
VAYRTDVTDLALLDETPIQQMAYTYSNNLLTATLSPDGALHTIAYTNGSVARLQKFITPDQSYDTHFRYNADGQLTHTINPLGRTNTLTYTQQGDLETIRPAAGPINRFTYDDLGFTRTSEIRTESGTTTGRITTFERDAFGRTTNTLYPDGLTEQIQYNGLGDIVQTTDRAGRVTDYEHVPTALAGTTRYLLEGGTSTPVRVGYDLDELTNILRIEEPAGRYVESYQLDIQNRIHSITNIEGQVQTFIYALGNRIKEYRRFDRSIVSNAYDHAGRLQDTIYPDATLTRTYHPDGVLKSLSERASSGGEESQSITYQYDLLNRLTNSVTTGAVGSSLHYQYDPNGNRAHTLVQFGSHTLQTTYRYDEAERLIQSGTDHYHYSPTHGQLESVSNSTLTAHNNYDLLNQLTGITYHNAQGEPIKVLEYERDAVGMITTKTEDGSTTHYAYDSLDRLINEYDGTNSVSYRYDLAGNRTAKISNGVATTYTLGTGNRLAYTTTHATNLLTITGTSNERIGTDDRWGELYVTNLTAETSVVPSVNGNQFYADLPAIEGVTNLVVSAIRDRAGNMGYSTNALYMPITSESSIKQYDYDPAGNLSQRGNQSLAWNLRYLLTSVTNADTSVVSYDYDVLNRLTSRTDSSGTVHYIYDGHHVITDLDENENLLRTYTYGQGIDAIQSMTTYGAETNTYHYLRDHLNSVVGLVDESGSIVERYEYDAFGNISVYNAKGAQIGRSVIGNRFTFQGRIIDWDTGLYNFRARWYDPETGRWSSKDPIGISGGLNQYTFVRNNPVNYIDPLGLLGRPMTPGAGPLDMKNYAEAAVITGNISEIQGEMTDIKNQILDEYDKRNPDDDKISELEEELGELQDHMDKITEASEKCIE